MLLAQFDSELVALQSRGAELTLDLLQAPLEGDHGTFRGARTREQALGPGVPYAALLKDRRIDNIALVARVRL